MAKPESRLSAAEKQGYGEELESSECVWCERCNRHHASQVTTGEESHVLPRQNR